jgi:hypothetical protein
MIGIVKDAISINMDEMGQIHLETKIKGSSHGLFLNDPKLGNPVRRNQGDKSLS